MTPGTQIEFKDHSIAVVIDQFETPTGIINNELEDIYGNRFYLTNHEIELNLCKPS